MVVENLAYCVFPEGLSQSSWYEVHSNYQELALCNVNPAETTASVNISAVLHLSAMLNYTDMEHNLMYNCTAPPFFFFQLLYDYEKLL